LLLEFDLVVRVQHVSFLDFSIGFGGFDTHGHFGEMALVGVGRKNDFLIQFPDVTVFGRANQVFL
jgi:hypothetical protein